MVSVCSTGETIRVDTMVMTFSISYETMAMCICFILSTAVTATTTTTTTRKNRFWLWRKNGIDLSTLWFQTDRYACVFVVCYTQTTLCAVLSLSHWWIESERETERQREKTPVTNVTRNSKCGRRYYITALV